MVWWTLIGGSVHGLVDFDSIESLSNMSDLNLCILGQGIVLPYLGLVRRFRGDDPHFGDFQSDLVPIYTSTQSD